MKTIHKLILLLSLVTLSSSCRDKWRDDCGPFNDTPANSISWNYGMEYELWIDGELVECVDRQEYDYSKSIGFTPHGRTAVFCYLNIIGDYDLRVEIKSDPLLIKGERFDVSFDQTVPGTVVTENARAEDYPVKVSGWMYNSFAATRCSPYVPSYESDLIFEFSSGSSEYRLRIKKMHGRG